MRIAGIDRNAETATLGQPAKQAVILTDHRSATTGCPDQDTAGANKALIGRHHHVASADQGCDFAIREPAIDEK